MTDLPRGRFITLEGGEGAGKSTQISRLATHLNKLGHETLETREPGGSPGAEKIRELLVNGPTDRWDGMTESLLHFAARREHVLKTIVPALERGEWVLCDRFADSTLAYQGYGHGVDHDVCKIVIPVWVHCLLHIISTHYTLSMAQSQGQI